MHLFYSIFTVRSTFNHQNKCLKQNITIIGIITGKISTAILNGSISIYSSTRGGNRSCVLMATTAVVGVAVAAEVAMIVVVVAVVLGVVYKW